MFCRYCDKQFGDEFEQSPFCDNPKCEEAHYAQSDGAIYARMSLSIPSELSRLYHVGFLAAYQYISGLDVGNKDISDRALKTLRKAMDDYDEVLKQEAEDNES